MSKSSCFYVLFLDKKHFHILFSVDLDCLGATGFIIWFGCLPVFLTFDIWQSFFWTKHLAHIITISWQNKILTCQFGEIKNGWTKQHICCLRLFFLRWLCSVKLLTYKQFHHFSICVRWKPCASAYDHVVRELVL